MATPNGLHIRYDFDVARFSKKKRKKLFHPEKKNGGEKEEYTFFFADIKREWDCHLLLRTWPFELQRECVRWEGIKSHLCYSVTLLNNFFPALFLFLVFSSHSLIVQVTKFPVINGFLCELLVILTDWGLLHHKGESERWMGRENVYRVHVC